MTITIGRVSITQNPSQVELNGDRLEIGGWFFGTTLANAKVIREQLNGLDNNPDEPDVPVTWTYDANVDGYYTIKSVAVSQIIGVSYEEFKFQYALTLERVQGGFAAPLCEVATSLAVRTNGHAVTAPVGRVSIPDASSFKRFTFSNGMVGSSNSNRSAETGVLASATVVVTSGSFVSASFAALPADHYDGAATIEQSVGGVWYPVVGDQIGTVVGNSLRIGNGLVRMTFHTDGVISSEMWGGAAWESATSFGFSEGGVALPWWAHGGWRVLRNEPSACTVQVSARRVSGGTPVDAPARTVTLHVERGKMLVELSFDSTYYDIQGSIQNNSLVLYAVTNTAATSLTGGIRQTSNDASGNRWLMLTPSTVTKDLVNGRLTIAAPGAPFIGTFGLGWERDGSASVNEYPAALVADEYMLVTGMRQRVVAR